MYRKSGENGKPILTMVARSQGPGVADPAGFLPGSGFAPSRMKPDPDQPLEKKTPDPNGP